MNDLIILTLVVFIITLLMGIYIFWKGRPIGGFQYLPIWMIILFSSVGNTVFMIEITFGNALLGVAFFIIIFLLQYIFDSYYKKKELARIKEKNRIFQEQAALETKKIRKQREKFEKEMKKVKEDQKIQKLRTMLDNEDEENKEDDEDDIDFELKEKKRKPISQSVKDKVWRRDEGKCVSCGSNENLEFDHIIPHSKGGADTYRNLQLLCEPCNRKKSDKIG
jgi:hypothetical protein